MTAISKKEALAAVNKARDKAQRAAGMVTDAYDKNGTKLDLDVAQAHYQRCVRELEEAINDAAPYEDGAE